MKKCIYTVIIGDYDNLKEPEYVTEGWDYICFTDQDFTSDVWKIVKVKDEIRSASKHSRKIKLQPHHYLPEYDLTLYIDASYKITGNLDDFCDTPIQDLSFVIRDLNRSVRDELADLVKYKTITQTESDNYTKILQDYDFDFSRSTYYMGGLILRKNTEFANKFMEAWWNLVDLDFRRDQIPLHYLLQKYEYQPGEFSTRWVRNYFSYHFHNTKLLFGEEKDPMVYYFTPADPSKKIGKVYNAHCEAVPNNEDWICVRDGDTMFLTSNWSEIIKSAIIRYPDTALFGCYTNRIGLDYQLTEHGFSENPDVKHHAQIARDRWETYKDECVEIQKPVAGMFMLFRRSVWTRVPFKDELVINNKFFDWEFGERVLKLGGKVRLIKGLYLFHYYRFHTGRQDKSHLL